MISNLTEIRKLCRDIVDRSDGRRMIVSRDDLLSRYGLTAEDLDHVTETAMTPEERASYEELFGALSFSREALVGNLADKFEMFCRERTPE